MSVHDDAYYEYALWRHLEEIRERRKKEPEWVKELLRQEPPKEQRSEDDLVQQYLEASLEQSRRAVRQLEHEVYVRERLHDQSFRQLDYQIAAAANSLSKFTSWGVGYNRGVDQKRIDLEHQLHALRKEQRTSRLQFWEDVVRLRSQLRELRRHYEMAARRSRLRIGD